MATIPQYEYEICWLQPDGSITFSALKAYDDATELLYNKEHKYYIPYEWVQCFYY